MNEGKANGRIKYLLSCIFSSFTRAPAADSTTPVKPQEWSKIKNREIQNVKYNEDNIKCISFLHGKRLLCYCSSFLPSCFSTTSRCWDALPPEWVFFLSAQPVCRRTARNSIRMKSPATNKMPKSKSHFHTTVLSNISI